MDLSMITNFISPIILIGCLGIGYALHSLNFKILDSFLPILSASLGVAAAIWSFGTVDLNTVVTGIISGLAATGMYEALKNMLNLPQTYATVMTLPEIPYGNSLEDTSELLRGEHFAKE